MNQLGFVVLASTEAPTRVGAFIGVPASSGSEPRIFGRGAARASDEYTRLTAVMQRPGLNLQLPAFENTALSRAQLKVTRDGNRLKLLNVGKCALSVNGSVVQSADVVSGDVLEIGRQLALLCVERPQTIEGDSAKHAYGEADEHGIVGESPAVWELRRQIAFVGEHAGHVLILGASGTGKELVAAAVHRLYRPGKPWVARNAATFPDTLIDAELYGNAKGYPNIGTPERKGLIGAAHLGSLFLDEFAELPITAQPHLLRVMDAGEYQMLGETSLRHSNFRLIAATNRPLSALRGDVITRFAFHIRVPELSARREDIPLLVRHWLRTLCREDPSLSQRFLASAEEPRLSAEFVAALARLPLTGNIRELRNVLWHAISASDGEVLTVPGAALEPALGQSEPDVAAVQLQAVLESNGGSQEKTWRALGLSSRFALMRLMKKHAVQIQKQPRRT